VGGLAGLFDLKGRSVAEGEAERLCAAESHRGEVRSWRGPGAELAAFRWDWEADPLAHDGEVVAAVHGLLFGAREPAAALLEAYRREGAACFDRLDGELAAVLWDGRRRSLFLVRDTFGTRPLFFARSLAGDVVAVATEIRRVRRAGLVPHAVDRVHVGLSLRGRPAPPGRTLFAGIGRVLPGQVEVLSSGVADSRRRGWTPPRRVDWQKTESDLVAAFRPTLARCLARRLAAPAGLALSGGLDSGAIAAVAGASGLVSASPARPGLIVAGTVAYPGRDCDETERARALAARWALPWFEADGLARGALRSADELGAVCDQPVFATAGQVPLLAAGLRDRGARLALFGLGGDDFWLGEWSFLADALLRDGPAAAWREAGAVARAVSVDSTRRRAALLWSFGVRPILSAGLPRTSDSVAWRLVLARQRDLHAGWSLENTEQILASHGLAPSYPFLDREMATLALATPPRLMSGGRRRKHALLLALADLLPPEYPADWKRVSFDRLVADELRERLEAEMGPMRTWALVREGLVRPERLDVMARTLREAAVPRPVALWGVIELESWLRRHASMPAEGARDG
jgi:asparagine synthase (glutamine-hydrolysing)